MIETNYKPRIVRGREPIEIWVPHEDKEIAFAHHEYGPDIYRDVANQIFKNKQKVPIGDYIVSLLYPAYCDKKVRKVKEFTNVRDTLHDDHLWVFNVNAWTNKGVYVIMDLEAKGRGLRVDINELEKALENGKDINGVRFSKDNLVRFAPKETYKFGCHTPDSLSKDGFIIASFGEEGAKKLAEVSSKFEENIFISGYYYAHQGDKISQRVSSLNTSHDDYNALMFSGNTYDDWEEWDDWDGSRKYYAFGIINNQGEK